MKSLNYILKIIFLISLLLSYSCSKKNALLKSEISNEQLIAFVKDGSKIFLIDAKGENEIQIYEAENKKIVSLAWSMNDNYLTFFENSDDEASLVILNLNDLTSKTLYNYNVLPKKNLTPVFRNDTTVIFSTEKEIVECDFSSNYRVLVRDKSIIDFCFLPTQNSILYSNDSSLVRIDLESNKRSEIFYRKNNYPFDNISVSVDESKILFSSGNTIFVFGNADSSFLISQIERDLPVFWLEWFRDKIIFQTGIKSGERGVHNFRQNLRRQFQGKMAFYISDIFGKNQKQFYRKIETASMGNPDLSNDLDYITLISNSLNSKRKVFLLSIESGNLLRLSSNGHADYPTWQNGNNFVTSN
ncbi:MAG: hypothetical protein D8M58_16100 [Calditrichaeota bacterium]|nr:MAG: hypothetical protein DWQ03_07830 [Calditrichota bacterium]MBL1206928.1 hypothetical protein [Calditrichota bacterium]NOG46755.1 hypothetical protein [Calditrichota bacterium]